MTYPLPTIACTVTAAGITSPALEDIVQSLIASYYGIYGSDVNLEVDTKDYARIFLEAQAQYDTNMGVIASYNNASPAKATGAGLQSNVKQSGIILNGSTQSTAVCTLGGQAGRDFSGGVVQDTNNNLWNLPIEGVIIPPSGVLDVTVTAQNEGAITAAAGSINKIYTPLIGWQTVTNAVAADVGQPVETDAELRMRQAGAAALPSISNIEGIRAAVAAVTGVRRSFVYNNDTSNPDANGIPGHSICAVVAGGQVADIANAIAVKKGPGCGTYGSSSSIVVDAKGVPNTIRFYPLNELSVYGNLSIKTLAGYVASTGVAAAQAMSDFTNSLAIGQTVYADWLENVASLTGSPLMQTFVILGLTLGFDPGALAPGDLAITFNQGAISAPGNFIITVVP